ncbi:glycosyltransferase family 2 protein [Dawidia soli]|uniref:Glycosyltransferase n=1 Tax=Dawidia soli TaxID=2782352 RepID=A0AAP2D7U4_9BACT|nr:glycosyltransferase [Dawidia soli]MBT1686729.1 glycosyltransferase [Dawidia soli]
MLFSIIIPTYNRADHIGRTITSLLSQNTTDAADFEIIVVDDGSTDNTAEVVGGLMKDSRLRYVKKENGERAAARNFGARMAGGEYVNFFDSDDLAYPHHIQLATATVQRLRSPEIFHLGYDVRSEDGKLLRLVNNLPTTINDTLIDGNHLSCGGTFVRADIWRQYPFNEDRGLSASEDYELWLRLASRFDIHCINTVTSTVVNHAGRSVININEEKFLLRMKLLREYLEKDEKFMNVYGSRLKTFLAYRRIYMALHMAMAKMSHKKVWNHLLMAIRYKPGVMFSRRFLAALKNMFV